MVWQITYIDQVDSTQDLVNKKASFGAPERLVIQAGQQLKGRGRHGTTWASLPDNLQMSVLLRPNMSANITPQISFVVAVAIAQAFPDIKNIGLKWPNDIFIGTQKCGGILIEAAAIGRDGIVPYVIIGIGLNICNAPEGGAVLGGNVDEARDKVLSSLSIYYALWQEVGFKPIRDLWLKKALRIGDIIYVRGEKMRDRGIFEGIDENGALLLRGDYGDIRTISAGEVWFKSDDISD